MLYVYAITGAPAADGGRGMLNAPLRTVGDQAPFAVVSEHGENPIGPSEDDLWAHEEIVESLMELGAVLPMRFGSVVDGEGELLDLLSERREEFEAALARVGGAVELGVRAQLSEAVEAAAPVGAGAGTDARPGTAYLLGRLEAQRRSDAVSALIHERLDDLARHSVRRSRAIGAGALNAAYLVDRERVEEFRRRVDDLTAEVSGATIVCTGPWPPYSFSAMEDAA